MTPNNQQWNLFRIMKEILINNYKITNILTSITLMFQKSKEKNRIN